MTGGSFQRLDPTPVAATIERLERRIAARFPERGLRKLAVDLVKLSTDVAERSGAARGRLRAARLVARTATAAVVIAVVVVFFLAFRGAGDDQLDSTLDWVQLIESTVNDLVFAAVALYFLHALPVRVERSRILALLHRLRSLAHIIDMHQLTKDPERLRESYSPTAESVEPGLGRDELEYYLDYCSELLSLVGKVAALCAEESQDPVVLDTVSTIETLTAGMSRKIWQKISVIQAM